MRTITKVLAILGLFSMVITTAYFINLYEFLTQLILVLFISALSIGTIFLFMYEWMQNKNEELEGLDKAIDMTREYVKDLEERYA